MGYKRANGDVGIRNDIWIIPTVGCANAAAKKLAELTGAKAYTHPYGCSQLGGDLETTQKVLAGLIKHPNAGGVLVLGLGCENNEINLMKSSLGDYDEKRIKFLILQDCEDEIEEGLKIITELKAITNADIRTEIPISALRIGVKCGGSDGYPRYGYRLLWGYSLKTGKSRLLLKAVTREDIAKGDFRCDLHARFVWGGKAISFDTTCNGKREVVVIPTTALDF